ncbi:MAG: hypothetical protein FWH02_01100 [Oscillospiraceae bacterium]|nr:hypothetical protein [Oscillospiraceae bacterium]
MKKIFALLLVAALVMSIAPTALAAAVTFKDGHDLGFSLSRFPETLQNVWVNVDGVTLANDSSGWYVDVGTKVAKGSATIVEFRNTGGIDPVAINEKIEGELRVRPVNNFAVKEVTKITERLDGATYVKGLKIVWAEEFRSVQNDRSFSFNIRLATTQDRNDRVLEVEGKFKEERDLVIYSGDSASKLNLGDARLLKVDATARNVTIADKGVEITTNFFANRNVWVKIDADSNNEDVLEFVDTYPRYVQRWFTIDSIGINSTIKFVDYARTEYVYFIPAGGGVDDAVYLGTANGSFEFLNGKYYIASSEITLANAVVDDDEPEDLDDLDDDDLDDFDIGGDTGGDSTPFNVNDNPGTGR